MTKKELNSNEYNAYYSQYINTVDDSTTLLTGFKNDQKMVVDFFASIPENKQTFKYQEGKWSIKEVLQHIIDTERIFMHRALRISRGDTTPMPGYEQDDYIPPSNADAKSMQHLIDEFLITRAYSINLIASLSDENLKNIGTASNSPMSARACAFILLGHSVWHINIIKERYL